MVDKVLPSSSQSPSPDVQGVSRAANDNPLLAKIQSDYLMNYLGALRTFVFASGKNDEFDSQLEAIENKLKQSQDPYGIENDIEDFVNTLNQQLGINIPLPSPNIERNNFDNYVQLGEEFYSFAVNSGFFPNGEPQGINFSKLRIDTVTGLSDMEELVDELNTLIQKINTALIGEDTGKTPGDLFPEFGTTQMNMHPTAPIGMNEDMFVIDDMSDSALTAVIKAFAAQNNANTDQVLQVSMSNRDRIQIISDMRKQSKEVIAQQLQLYTDRVNQQVMDRTQRIEEKADQRIDQINDDLASKKQEMRDKSNQKIDQINQKMVDEPEFKERGEYLINQEHQELNSNIQKLDERADQSIKDIKEGASARIQQVRDTGDRLIREMSRTLASLALQFDNEVNLMSQMASNQDIRLDFATREIDQGMSAERLKFASKDYSDRERIVMDLDQERTQELPNPPDSMAKKTDLLDRPLPVQPPTFMNLKDRVGEAKTKKLHDSGERV